jgi:hypothetical protein
VIVSLIGITTLIKIVTLICGIVGVTRQDRRVNGSIPAIIFCSIGIEIDLIGIIVTMAIHYGY